MWERSDGNRRLRARARLRAFGVVVLLCVLALPVVAAFNVAVAAYVPGISPLLGAFSSWLPQRIAWQHDSGSVQLRSGAYFGWTTGQGGQLYLLGQGCASGTTSLTLKGASTLELPPEKVVTETLSQLGNGPRQVLKLQVALPHTASFDRAVLRCRDGTEYYTRLTATVQFVDSVHLVNTPTAGPEDAGSATVPLLIGATESFPAVGLVGELRLVSGSKPIRLLGVDYAAPVAATGQVLAAVGNRAALPWWRRQATLIATTAMSAADHARALAQTEPEALTPWDVGYESLVGSRTLARRSSDQLDLLLDGAEVLFLAVTQASLVPTAEPRPILSSLLLSVQLDGHTFTLIPEGLAYGWTARP